ncbi:SDR family oxidoreductase [Pseudomonas saudiphocaensis]|uniref:SDR family oxidoreductase n=1 Tax=Pseudomonas saudiphocaensis TaxID=1499686 RepID=UPI00187D58DF|nr:SDR family oxidoreductase [Pseudomonas saudiphocaensis]MBE7926141.1 SDR family oxidoreductase [Pseudomonas saudiphocaensis]
MRILLVGASGFIGRHLLRALHAEGHSLVATSRSGQGSAWSEVEWRALDLVSLATDAAHFRWPPDINLLINVTGVLSTDPGQLSAVQDQGARALFELAAAHGTRVIQLSALGAGDQPDVPFLASKSLADKHLLGLNVPAVVLRPSLVLGEGGASSGWLSRMSPWPLIPVLSTQVRMQPLHVDDLVAAVLGLLRRWPERSCVLPLVGPQAMTLPQLLDQLRAAQGWAPARYLQVPAPLAGLGARLGDRFGWRALNTQTLSLARRDNLADTGAMKTAIGFAAAPLASRLSEWPRPDHSVTAALRPLLLAVLVLIWLGTAVVCLGPGHDWGLRIMAEVGVHGWMATAAVAGGALVDGLLGIGLLLRRWRRHALRAQLALMLGYMLIISLWLPHYWLDPFAAVAKNAVLLVATLWLLWTEPQERRR